MLTNGSSWSWWNFLLPKRRVAVDKHLGNVCSNGPIPRYALAACNSLVTDKLVCHRFPSRCQNAMMIFFFVTPIPVYGRNSGISLGVTKSDSKLLKSLLKKYRWKSSNRFDGRIVKSSGMSSRRAPGQTRSCLRKPLSARSHTARKKQVIVKPWPRASIKYRIFPLHMKAISIHQNSS